MRSSSLAILGSAVLALAAASSASAQIVTNGGFETGDFTGWTQFGNTEFTGVDGTVVHSGNFAARFGAIGSPGGIVQTLATTAGDAYSFTFWLQNDGGTPNSFDAFWNGTDVYSLSQVDGFGYMQETFTEVATGSSTDIAFDIQQDPLWFSLDDVSVTDLGSPQSVTPEPATMGLLATGLVGMAGFGRRRRAK